ncbi:MAG TPA: hypothetical protein DIU07_14120, partial [Rhodobacteraceae bacterium]|nr:hypothetical protein [Paracoccaceae bacterium]
VLPGTLSAQCPTSDDLAAGIAFTGAQGEREVFTDLGDGMVTASYRTQDGFSAEALLAHGVFLVDLLDLVGTEEESRTSYEFPLALNDIQLPQAGETWDVLVSVSDGKNNVFERQVYTYGTVEEHRYGDCAYEVIPVTTEYSTAPDVVETYHYLPALGLSYLYAYVDPTGEATYPYTEIRALP